MRVPVAVSILLKRPSGWCDVGCLPPTDLVQPGSICLIGRNSLLVLPSVSKNCLKIFSLRLSGGLWGLPATPNLSAPLVKLCGVPSGEVWLRTLDLGQMFHCAPVVPEPSDTQEGGHRGLCVLRPPVRVVWEVTGQPGTERCVSPGPAGLPSGLGAEP